jgi:hypothetical protein
MNQPNKGFITTKLSSIKLDIDIYPRQKTIESNVHHLQTELERVGKLDPMVVAEIEGKEGYWLVDGAHRREVYLRKGIKNVEVENLGVLSKKEAFTEAYERNSHGPMQLSATDRRLAASKARVLGFSVDEVHVLTGYPETVILTLDNIVYKDTAGRPSHIPQALTKMDRDTGVISLKPGITHTDIQAHANIVEKIPRSFSLRAVLRALNFLLDLNWLDHDMKHNKEVRKMAKKLNDKLTVVLRE